jgi:hypothetical protein
MQHKDNNLNLLRLVAALMVLYAHSFAFYGTAPAGFLGLDSFGQVEYAMYGMTSLTTKSSLHLCDFILALQGLGCKATAVQGFGYAAQCLHNSEVFV